ncbi:MAG: DctP family TRAP transporter solute-binding subunit [Oscillospiraceae bacterium]|nr:DctP family TRAP transporter solute-binding subunit [Oscillospiraceae bacterium]
MKKILAILLAAIMMLSMVACGGGSTGGDDTANDSGYESMNIMLTCNGQSDAANDCIGANLFKQYIEEESDGAITVTVYNNDQLAGGDMTKGLELVVNGTVQIDIHSTSIISNLDNRLLVSCLPWTFADYAAAEEAFFGEGGEFVASVLAEKGLTYLGALHNGFKCMTSSKKQITSPADLVGQKIRTPGGDLWNGFWAALGASPQAMSWAEVYTAMQQGTIDGHDNSPSTINSANVQEVQEFITVSNHTYEAFTWTANTAWFEGLNAETQELIKSCAEKACKDANDQIEASMEEILSTWEAGGFNKIYRLSAEEVDVFKAAVADVTNEFKGIYGADACAAFNIQ